MIQNMKPHKSKHKFQSIILYLLLVIHEKVNFISIEINQHIQIQPFIIEMQGNSKKISTYFQVEALALKSNHFNAHFLLSITTLFNKYSLKSQDFIKKIDDDTLQFSQNSYLFEHSEELQIVISKSNEPFQAYFRLELSRILKIPEMNHIIDIKLGWISTDSKEILKQKGEAACLELRVTPFQKIKGKFIVKFLDAKLTHNTQTIGQMDPFIICKLGSTTLKTKTDKSGGRTPKWNEQLTFQVTKISGLLQIDVKDKDITSDDLVGSKFIDIFKEQLLMTSDYCPIKEFQIDYKGKPAGKVRYQSKLVLDEC